MELSNEIYFDDLFLGISKIQNSSIDLIICDGAYNAVNCSEEWDNVKSISEYNQKLLNIFHNILKDGGSLYLFGKPNAIDEVKYSDKYILNNKIVWVIENRLRQSKNRYTNNYDMIYYFSKGKAKTFNLDDIRTPQKTKYKKTVESVPSVMDGTFNKTKYNPLGKNPGDVWSDIKALTYKSKELLNQKLHTIQKPEKLIQRIILCSSNENDLILDAFSGTGTGTLVAKLLKRNSISFETDKEMYDISCRRKEQILTNNVLHTFL